MDRAEKYVELLEQKDSDRITCTHCQGSLKALEPNKIVRLAREGTMGDLRVRLVGQNVRVGEASTDGLVHASLRVQSVDRGAYLNAQFHALY